MNPVEFDDLESNTMYYVVGKMGILKEIMMVENRSGTTLFGEAYLNLSSRNERYKGSRWNTSKINVEGQYDFYVLDCEPEEFREKHPEEFI